MPELFVPRPECVVIIRLGHTDFLRLVGFAKEFGGKPLIAWFQGQIGDVLDASAQRAAGGGAVAFYAGAADGASGCGLCCQDKGGGGCRSGQKLHLYLMYTGRLGRLFSDTALPAARHANLLYL